MTVVFAVCDCSVSNHAMTGYWNKMKRKYTVNIFVTPANQHGIADIVNLRCILQNTCKTLVEIISSSLPGCYRKK